MSHSRKDNSTSSSSSSSQPTYTFSPRITVSEGRAEFGAQLFQDVLRDAPRGGNAHVTPQLIIQPSVNIITGSSASRSSDGFSHYPIRKEEEYNDPRVIRNLKVTVTASSLSSSANSSSSKATPPQTTRPNNTIHYAPSVTVGGTTEYVANTINLSDLLDEDEATIPAEEKPTSSSSDIRDLTVTVKPGSPRKTPPGLIETADSVVYNPSVIVRDSDIDAKLKEIDELRGNVPDPSDYPNKSMHITQSITYKGNTRTLTAAEMLARYGQYKTQQSSASNNPVSKDDSKRNTP